jgi:hypothetical protein
LSGVFEGTLDAPGEKLVGTWSQGGGPLPLEFTRSGPAAPVPAASVVVATRTFPFGLPLTVEALIVLGQSCGAH